LRPHDLPAVSKPTNGIVEIVTMPPGAEPRLPDGFSAALVPAKGMHKPRVIRVAPNGDLFVADTMFNSVHVLRIPAGRATPEQDTVFASGLKQPYGIAFYPPGPNPQWVYVANSDSVVRFRYQNGDLEAAGPSSASSTVSPRRITTRATSSSRLTGAGCSCRSAPDRTWRWTCFPSRTGP
jgi:glucose/arabinose dehydrogenase